MEKYNTRADTKADKRPGISLLCSKE